MIEYQINKNTLAIIPINKDKCIIYEKNDNFLVNLSSLKIISDSCSFFGSSYIGRFEGTKNMISISRKAPIIIEETSLIIFFPTKSPRLFDCSWISFNNLKSYEKYMNYTVLKFYCGKSIKLNIKYEIIDNQVLRSSRLQIVYQNRIKSII